MLRSTFSSLPSSIHVEAGRITIEFPANQPEAALPLLYELSMAMANDFHNFGKICSLHVTGDAATGGLLDVLQHDKQVASGNAQMDF